MNKGTVRLVGVIAALVVLSGCSGLATHQLESANRSILSGAEAQSMIRVSVEVTESPSQAVTPDTPSVAALSN